MRIALLSPKGPLYRHREGVFRRSLRYAPLTLTTLAALIPEDIEAHVSIIDEGVEPIDTSIDADLVAMTVITGSATRSYELANVFRRRGVTVVLGGPHVTLLPEEAMLHADAVVTGYADESWPRLIRDFAANRMKKRYDQRAGLELRCLPEPRRDLLKPGAYLTTHTFEATRGCAHRCEFCVVPTLCGGRLYQRPVREVVEEIKRRRSRVALFLDLNLMADPAYARAFFEAIIPLELEWYGLATTLIARDPELLSLAARSGCAGLLLGFESLSPGSLRKARKGFNSPVQYRELITRMHEHRIAINGTFVLGLDDDGPDTFERTLRFVNEAKIDIPRFTVLTPFPGTPLFDRLEAEGRILSTNWERYDGQHVVFQPAHMSARALQGGLEWTWRGAYRWGAIARRLSGLWRRMLVRTAANVGYRFYANRLNGVDELPDGSSRPGSQTGRRGSAAGGAGVEAVVA